MADPSISAAASLHDTIVILDAGSQFTQLIARRVRENGVYCAVVNCDVSEEQLKRQFPNGYKGIIISGSDASSYGEGAPQIQKFVFDKSREAPVLGFCYGMQFMARYFDGEVQPATHKEYGYTELSIPKTTSLITAAENHVTVWMSHGDSVSRLPEGFEIIASTNNCPIAAFANESAKLYGLQFHPEVTETCIGEEVFRRYLFEITNCRPSWQPSQIVADAIAEIRATVGKDDVLLAVSGGVDSTTCAVLLHKAIGKRLKCMMVDSGLLRLDEAAKVRARISSCVPDLQLEIVDASEVFLSRLQGVHDPEDKRKIIGKAFVDVFQDAVKSKPEVYGRCVWLGQGTLYPDIIESGMAGKSTLIKSHHNVGGLPRDMNLKVLEPVRNLFKDEVRKIGLELGLPRHVVMRHPFPGPGLGVRLLGDITAERLDTLRHADAIFVEELRKADLYDKHSQAFAVLLPVKSVAVKGDARAHEEVIALRCVETLDFMTARSSELDWKFIKNVGRRICNECRGVSRVVYDLSDKPPGTIEWE